MYKVGDLVEFEPLPSMFDLFEDEYSVKSKTAIVIKVKKLLKRVDLLTQTENKIYKNVSFEQIQKII